MSAWPELIGRGLLWWVDHKPFSAEAKARRKAKRAARKAKRDGPLPDDPGESYQPERKSSMAVNTGLRSSSNMVIAGGVANIVVEVVQMIWPDFVLSPEMRVNLTLGIAWLASRFSKTPDAPKIV